LDAQFATENELASSISIVESPSVVVAAKEDEETQEDGVESDSSLHSSSSTAAASANDNLYRLFYFRNPCVPLDFDTINEALKHCPRTKLSTTTTTLKQHSSSTHDSIIFSENGTVVLMPGVYDERVDISGEPWSVGQATFDKSIAIRASFPLVGATIRSPTLYSDDDDADVLDQPCISISTRDEETLEGVQKGISVRLSHLRILHSTPGVSSVLCVAVMPFTNSSSHPSQSALTHSIYQLSINDRLTFGVVIQQSILKDHELESLLIHVYYRVIQDVAWLLLLKLFVNCTKLVLSTVPQLASTWVIGKMFIGCDACNCSSLCNPHIFVIITGDLVHVFLV